MSKTNVSHKHGRLDAILSKTTWFVFGGITFLTIYFFLFISTIANTSIEKTEPVITYTPSTVFSFPALSEESLFWEEQQRLEKDAEVPENELDFCPTLADISGLSLEEVKILQSDYETKKWNTAGGFGNKGSTVALCNQAYSLIPEKIAATIPLSNLTAGSGEGFTGNGIYNTDGSINYTASTSNKKTDYYFLYFVGQVANNYAYGVTHTDQWQEAYEEEADLSFYSDREFTPDAAFADQFACYMLGDYSAEYNKLHTPKMVGLIEIFVDCYEDFYDIGSKRREREFAYKANKWYKTALGNSELTSEERVSNVLSFLPPQVAETANQTGLCWEYNEGVIMDGDKSCWGQFYPIGCVETPDNPKIKLDTTCPQFEQTTLHELGHFVNWYLKTYAGINILEQFETAYEKEFSSTLQSDDGYDYDRNEDYDPSLISEYWACEFAHCASDIPEVVEYYKTYCPEIYACVDRSLNLLEERKDDYEN